MNRLKSITAAVTTFLDTLLLIGVSTNVIDLAQSELWQKVIASIPIIVLNVFSAYNNPTTKEF